MLLIGYGQTISFTRPASRTPTARLAALTVCALALGAGATVLGVSLVQAGDDASARAFLHEESQRGRATGSPNIFNALRSARPVPVSAPAFYAPAPRPPAGPVFRAMPGGKLLEPAITLNPFAPRSTGAERSATRKAEARIRSHELGGAYGPNTVSGAASSERTICVRLCDGFHAPIGYLNTTGDMPAHEALCRAGNPGVPVKVFRVSAGAATIDGATSLDGKTYAALPMAYAYEKSGDQACRPAIAQAHERRVSLLRDFTLRAGDTVVLDGQAKVFSGAAQWPYRASDFRDFRSSQQLNPVQRQRIDQIIGLSRLEATRRTERRAAMVREASLLADRMPDSGIMSDIGPVFLRGTISSGPGPVRVVAPFLSGPVR